MTGRLTALQSAIFLKPGMSSIRPSDHFKVCYQRSCHDALSRLQLEIFSFIAVQGDEYEQHGGEAPKG